MMVIAMENAVILWKRAVNTSKQWNKNTEQLEKQVWYTGK